MKCLGNPEGILNNCPSAYYYVPVVKNDCLTGRYCTLLVNKFDDNAVSVSYTHLDVYKRQAIHDGYGSDLIKTGRVVASIGSTAGVLFYSDIAVSYTHLDVYKRQNLT